MGFGQLSLKGRALRYLAQREHSRAELVRKLAPHVQDTPELPAGEQLQRLLDELAAGAWQSEARVADSVLASKGARFGSLKLRQTLLSKGLEPALISATLQQARATEHERALEVWRRKFGTPAQDAQGRARQQRFLAGRGFAGDVIQSVIRRGDDEDV